MSNQLIAVFSSLLLLFVSCSKEEDSQEESIIYTIQGTLLYDCNNEPVANFAIRLYQPKINFWLGAGEVGGVLASTVTDNQGRFLFHFSDKEGLYQQIDFFTGSSYSTIVENLPVKTNLTDLKLHLSAVYHANIYLDVKAPYSSEDTLFYTDVNVLKHTFITGPFKSQLLYQVRNQQVLDMKYPVPKGVFQYWINNDTVRRKNYPISVCDTTEVSVIIE